MFRLPAGASIAHSPESARWAEDALADAPFATVRGEIPAVFEGYARILHPARRRVGNRWDAVRWAEVAAETGATVHRLMQFERIAKIPDDPNTQLSWGERPRSRGVCDIVTPLFDILRRHTSVPDRSSVGIWEGYGGLDMVPELSAAPRMSKPHRTYLLIEVRGEPVTGFCERAWEPPSVWWPEDRAWFVATDIDIDSTYVGGSRSCVDEILGHSALEAFPAELDDPIHIGSDLINPPS